MLFWICWSFPPEFDLSLARAGKHSANARTAPVRQTAVFLMVFLLLPFIFRMIRTSNPCLDENKTLWVCPVFGVGVPNFWQSSRGRRTLTPLNQGGGSCGSTARDLLPQTGPTSSAAEC